MNLQLQTPSMLITMNEYSVMGRVFTTDDSNSPFKALFSLLYLIIHPVGRAMNHSSCHPGQ